MIEVKELGTFTEYRPPSWDKLFMRMVYEYASKSKDPSTKIGAVIVRNKRPILFGYNGFPEGVQDKPERLLNRDIKLRFTEHGERNAIDMAAAEGTSTKDTTLYTQILPCRDCAKAILQAKIAEVVIHRPADEYFAKCNTGGSWSLSHEDTNLMFKERGINIRYVEELVGCVGYLGGKMIAL